MKQIILSPKAKSDLDGIWEYTQNTWGMEKAESYTRNLWHDLQLLAENPKLATSADHIRKNYRKAISASHVIFLKEIDHGIDVVRILHQRMDFKEKI